MISRSIAALLPLALVVIAFSLVLGGPRGPAKLFSGLGKVARFLLRQTFKLGLFALITLVDGVLTAIRATIHAISVIRAPLILDDWLDFLVRLDDRFFRLVLS